LLETRFKDFFTCRAGAGDRNLQERERQDYPAQKDAQRGEAEDYQGMGRV
jgi:hypothetical protein